MWIRKLYRRSVRWWKTLQFSNRTERDHEKNKLLLLDPILFQSCSPATACVFSIRAIYKGLDTYNQKLSYVNYLLAQKAAVPNSWCRYEVTPTTLERMWVNDKGLRIDPVIQVEEFKALSLTFLDHYHLIKDQQVDIDGHNARMLATFKNAVLSLADDLLQYSLS